MSKQGQNISPVDPSRKYFASIPYMVSHELTPIQLALYTNYVQTCGIHQGVTYKSYETLADECNMSPASVKRARNELEKLGLIQIESFGRGKPANVAIVDVWEQNIKYVKERGNVDAQKAIFDSIKKDGSVRPNLDSKVCETKLDKKDGSVRPNLDVKDGSVRPINKNTTKKEDKELIPTHVGEKQNSQITHVQKTDVIKAWIDNLPAKPIDEKNPYQKKGYLTTAERILASGYTSDDVSRFVKAMAQDNFWKSRKFAFGRVLSDMPAWIQANPRKRNTSAPPPSNIVDIGFELPPVLELGSKS